MGDRYRVSYRSQSHIYSFFCEVQKQYPDMHRVFLILGGRKKCVIVSVYLDGDHPNLDAVGYDQNCNLEANLIRGSGSVMIIHVAMTVVYKLYPQLRSSMPFELVDKSHISCRSNYELELPFYYVAKHNKTWYESKLGARPEVQEEWIEYRAQKRRLSRFLRSTVEKPSWTDFISKYLVPSSLRRNADFKQWYESANTLHDFISECARRDCVVFRKWLGILVSSFIPRLVGMHWIVSLPESFAQRDVQLVADASASAPQRRMVDQANALLAGDLSIIHGFRV